MINIKKSTKIVPGDLISVQRVIGGVTYKFIMEVFSLTKREDTISFGGRVVHSNIQDNRGVHKCSNQDIFWIPFYNHEVGKTITFTHFFKGLGDDCVFKINKDEYLIEVV